MAKVPWDQLLYLKRTDFQQPDAMQAEIVQPLDRFIGLVGQKPTLLDDYRDGDPRQHGKGLAVDTFWAGQDPVDLRQKALDAKLFTGIGIYVNEQGVASFHFDKRTGDDAQGYWINRTPDNPAIWGGIIEHPYDESSGRHVKKISYVSADIVVDMLKKKAPLLVLLLLSLLLYGLSTAETR